MVRRVLENVGDAALGEWVEDRFNLSGVVHLRRRLSHDEEPLVNAVRDIRGTEEERQRLNALIESVPFLSERIWV